MQFTAIIALAMSLTFAIAAPHYESEHHKKEHKKVKHVKDPKPTVDKCNNNQAQACCDSPSDTSVLGSLCSTLPILSGTCTGSVQCCDVNQDGALNLVNLCIPIALQ